jgi:hypothetical protein
MCAPDSHINSTQGHESARRTDRRRPVRCMRWQACTSRTCTHEHVMHRVLSNTDIWNIAQVWDVRWATGMGHDCDGRAKGSSFVTTLAPAIALPSVDDLRATGTWASSCYDVRLGVGSWLETFNPPTRRVGEAEPLLQAEAEGRVATPTLPSPQGLLPPPRHAIRMLFTPHGLDVGV